MFYYFFVLLHKFLFSFPNQLLNTVVFELVVQQYIILQFHTEQQQSFFFLYFKKKKKHETSIIVIYRWEPNLALIGPINIKATTVVKC